MDLSNIKNLKHSSNTFQRIKKNGEATPLLLTNNYIMKQDLKILKEVFTRKNIIYAILFNILAYSSMYGFLYLVLFLRYDLGWI